MYIYNREGRSTDMKSAKSSQIYPARTRRKRKKAEYKSEKKLKIRRNET